MEFSNFILFLLLLTQSNPTCNNFKVGDHTYDLTPLRTKLENSQGFNDPLKDGFKSTDGSIMMGMCGNNAKKCTNYFTPATFISQFDPNYGTSTCTSEPAFWTEQDPQWTYGATCTSPPSQQNINLCPYSKGESKGFTLQFSNGQYCPTISKEREVKINFICDEKQEYPANGFTWSELSTCIYNIDFPTKYACHTPDNPDGPDDGKTGGLSGGWVLIILFLCLVFVYCVGGVVYNKRYETGKEGMEVIPQKDFWCSIPNYTLIGCKVSWTWTYSLFAKICPCCKDEQTSNGDVYDTDGPMAEM